MCKSYVRSDVLLMLKIDIELLKLRITALMLYHCWNDIDIVQNTVAQNPIDRFSVKMTKKWEKIEHFEENLTYKC